MWFFCDRIIDANKNYHFYSILDILQLISLPAAEKSYLFSAQQHLNIFYQCLQKLSTYFRTFQTATQLTGILILNLYDVTSLLSIDRTNSTCTMKHR